MNQNHKNLCVFDTVVESSLREFDIDTMKGKIEVITEGVFHFSASKVMDATFSSSNALINAALESIDNVSANYDEVLNFFKNTETAKSLSMTIPLLNPADVEKIRPSYFENLMMDFKSVVGKIVEGKMDKIELQSKWLSVKYFNNYLLRLVKCDQSLLDDYNVNRPNVDIYKKRAKSNQINIDSAVAFLNKLPDNVKTLKSIIDKYNQQLNLIGETIDNCSSTLSRLSSDGSISAGIVKTVNLYYYNFVTRLIRLIKIVSFIISYKANCYSLNLSSYARVYTMVGSFRKTYETVNESAFDRICDDTSKADIESLLHGDNSFYALSANRVSEAINRLMVRNGVSSLKKIKDEDELRRTDYNYSLVPYKNASIVFKNINHSLEIVRDGLTSDTPFDVIISGAKLDKPLMESYGEIINKIADVTYYTSAIEKAEDNSSLIEIIDRAITEVNDYGELTKMVINEVCNTYENMVNLARDITYRQELFATDNITLREMLDYFKDVDVQYNKLVSTLAYTLSLRLNRFENIISEYAYLYEEKQPSQTVMLDNNDYEALTMEFTEATDKKFDEFYMESLMYEYTYLRALNESGIRMVFEADENDASLKNRVGELLGKIKDFFGGKIKAFTDKAENESNKNLEFIKANKEYLLNRDYTGSEVKVLPYENISLSTIKSNVSGFTSKINSLNVNTLSSLNTEDSIYEHFYDFVRKDDNSSAKQKVYDYFKCGDSKLELKSYKNDALKEHVKKMIQYVEDYYNGDGKAIRDELKRIGDSTENKLNNLANMLSTQKTTNESVMTEADSGTQGNDQSNNTNKTSSKPEINDVKNKNTDATVKDNGQSKNIADNRFNQLKWISDSSQYLTSAVSNGIRDRVYDYLKILNGLKSSSNNTSDNNTNNQTEDNQESK